MVAINQMPIKDASDWTTLATKPTALIIGKEGHCRLLPTIIREA